MQNEIGHNRIRAWIQPLSVVWIAIVVTFWLGLSSCGGSSTAITGVASRTVSLSLSPANEVPAVVVPSNAKGSATVTLDVGARLLLISGTFQDLTSPLRLVGGASGHVHLGNPTQGQTSRQATGPILYGLVVRPDPGNQSGKFDLTITLDPDTFTKIQQGAAYLNIHTDSNPAGELRAQIEF